MRASNPRGTGGGGGGQQGAQFRVTSLYEFVDALVMSIAAEGEESQELYNPFVSTDLTMLKQMEALLTIDDTTTREGRIDMNFARPETLAGLPNVSQALIDEIVNNAGTWQTPGELVQRGIVDIETMRQIEPFLTTGSRTYRFTSIGLWQSGGPIVRMEYVLDAAEAVPVILRADDLTRLGAGYRRDQILPADVVP